MYTFNCCVCTLIYIFCDACTFFCNCTFFPFEHIMCTIIYLPKLGVPFAIVPLKVVKLRLFEIIFKHCVFVQFLLLHTADKRQFSSQQEKSKGNKIFWQKTLHCRNGPFSSFREKRRASLFLL